MKLEGCRVAFETLGCKLNFSETSSIRRDLEGQGAVTVNRNEQPDLIVVNTCSVTDMAEKKARQMIRNIHRKSPMANIAVVGCYAQLRADELMAMDGVVCVVGAKEKMHLCEKLQELQLPERESHGCEIFSVKGFDGAYSYGDRTRSFLKIQDGCNYFCSYCTIPYARGISRSATIEQVVADVDELASKGVKEIILTGVNTGEFGVANGESLLELMQVLDARNDIERYRISSIEPNLLTDEIIKFIAESKHFMPHFHIPLQAGSDEVLKLMRRRYDTVLFAEKVATIRKYLPLAFIGVDIIAGMRGETDELFEKSVEFVKSLDVSKLHVFPYSERSGTKALEIPYIVPQHEKHKRVERLLEVSNVKMCEFVSKNIGQVHPVLFESKQQNGMIYGFTDNYLKVVTLWDKSLVNSVVTMELTQENLLVDDDNPL